MPSPPAGSLPLISVIIPCYNQAAYLPEALASVWQQDYPAVEVILVDDGSTDATGEVARAQPAVHYVYQLNQGPSAARNTGLSYARGRFVVFLDADDWLLPQALRVNAEHLLRNPQAAFVSGGHQKVFVAPGRVVTEAPQILENHYVHLLHGNYIGMLATVMYQRWALDRFTFDPQVRGSEDYDLFLRITRVYPVLHHTQLVAAYRMHAASTSADTAWMLSSALAVLHRQQQHLRNAAEQQAYLQGQATWADYYMNAGSSRPSRTQAAGREETLGPAGGRLSAVGAISHFLRSETRMLKQLLKKYMPDSGLKLLFKSGHYKGYVPAVGKVEAGDFERPTPFSNRFGYDRGGPIDRYYIENFLRAEGHAITGRVLEIGDNEYTLRFGRQVTQSDILHVDAQNDKATFTGDLSSAAHIPDNLFDCLILTQTLHLIYDYKQALATCHRILKPGGCLLLTTPGITPIDKDEWKKTWYWSFTDQALHRVFNEMFKAETLEITSFGNVYIASAFLYGMGVSEVTAQQLNHYDPQFQVITTVKAVKAATRA